jgi:hypothetical protein
MGSVQFHWNCIMPMNLTFRAADCKSALRGFMGRPEGQIILIEDAGDVHTALTSASGPCAMRPETS